MTDRARLFLLFSVIGFGMVGWGVLALTGVVSLRHPAYAIVMIIAGILNLAAAPFLGRRNDKQ